MGHEPGSENETNETDRCPKILIRAPFSGHYILGLFQSKDDFCIQPASPFLDPTASLSAKEADQVRAI